MGNRPCSAGLFQLFGVLFISCNILTPADGSALPVQLVKANFSSYIETVPSAHGVLMEFYASWCPACQRFQPVYEKVSGYFNAEPKVEPEVVIARVDCATQVITSFHRSYLGRARPKHT